MIDVTIDSRIRTIAPSLCIGLVTCDVAVSESPPALWGQYHAAAAKALVTGASFFQAIEFVALRNLIRHLGKDPSRYRGSAEALYRRLIQGKELYRINSVVDVNNLVSLETRHAVGTYNVAAMAGPIEFRPGRPGERYKGIGKLEYDLEGLPVFADESGPFGSPFSDSERTMVLPTSSTVCMAIIACSGPSGIPEALAHAADLLTQFAAAENVVTAIRS